MTKAQIRDRMKEERSKMPNAELVQKSKLIHEQLLQTKAYGQCSKIFSFVSFGNEVDTRELISRALAEQKIVYVPRVEKKNLEFYEIQNLSGLIPSKFGVPEPEINPELRFSLSSCEPMETALMIMPGLAFDLIGNRIGYGAGYYDSYLSRLPSSQFIKIAIAFDFQVIKQIPAEEYDVLMDAIITPTRIITCKPSITI